MVFYLCVSAVNSYCYCIIDHWREQPFCLSGGHCFPSLLSTAWANTFLLPLELEASGKWCCVAVFPSPLTDDGWFWDSYSAAYERDSMRLVKEVRVHTLYVCSPVRFGRDVFSSLADGVETLARPVPPSPSAEGTPPCSASSSSLSSLPVSSAKTHAV